MKDAQDAMNELLNLCKAFGVKTVGVDFNTEGTMPKRKVIYLGYSENSAPALATWNGERWHFGYGCTMITSGE